MKICVFVFLVKCLLLKLFHFLLQLYHHHCHHLLSVRSLSEDRLLCRGSGLCTVHSDVVCRSFITRPGHYKFNRVACLKLLCPVRHRSCQWSWSGTCSFCSEARAVASLTVVWDHNSPFRRYSRVLVLFRCILRCRVSLVTVEVRSPTGCGV